MTKSPGDPDGPQWTDAHIIEAMRDAYEKRAKKHKSLFRNRHKQLFQQDSDE